MFQDFTHSKTGILFFAVCVALCSMGRLEIDGGGGGCNLLSLDGFALPSQRPYREQGSRGHWPCWSPFTLLVCHPAATGGGLPLPRRLGDLLTNGGSCWSENV